MFASKQPAPGAKTRAAGSGLSFIGPEVIISGDLASDAQLQVDGRIDGNVRCAGLSQGPDGIIAGNIFADEARLAGSVEGTVSAATIAIEASARILGDVAYETISIEAGATIEGRLGRRAGAGDGEAQRELIATPVSFSPARTAEGEARGVFTLPDPAR
jgi:cytoskeletal protein CcmA (bactofilin family)